MFMNLKLDPVTGQCVRRRISSATVALFASLWVQGAGAVILQSYYIPVPEEPLRTTNLQINNSPNNFTESTISVTIGTDTTILYYDHWEDGFESDIELPIQSSTLIIGDGNTANGCADDFKGAASCIDDTVSSGDILTFRSPLPGVPSNPRGTDLYYDGSDYLAVTRPISVTRVAWPNNIRTLLAGAVEVFPVYKWGTRYTSPVGENAPGQTFDITQFYIMASEDGTSVDVDLDGNGTVDITQTLNRGESYLADNVQIGGTVTTNHDVQVHLITGFASNYSSRWYTLLPEDDWSDTYLAPVYGTTDAPVSVLLFNPDPASDLIVNVTRSTGTLSVTVPAGDLLDYSLGTTVSGTQFKSSDGRPFFAIASYDHNDTANDWGFALQPRLNLSRTLKVGWAPGADFESTNYSSGDNFSPVWITSAEATRVCVSWDDDGVVDVNQTISAYEVLRLLDTSDDDQSGALIWSSTESDCSNEVGAVLASAWGQDSATAPGGEPSIDVGTTVIATPLLEAVKKSKMVVDLNSDEVVNQGDTLRYTIYIYNTGRATMDNLIIEDILDANVIYVAGSTFINGSSQPDEAVPQSMTAFPLDEGGYLYGELPVNTLVTASFDVQIDPLLDASSSPTISNRANLGTDTATRDPENEVVVTDADYYADVSIVKTGDLDLVLTGETLMYTLTVSNAGPNIAQSGVVVTDTLPAEVTYNSASVTTGTGTCSFANPVVTCNITSDIAVGATAVVSISVSVE